MNRRFVTLSMKPVVVLALYSVLAVALTFPLAANLTTAVPNDIGDPLLNTWILAWDSHALLTDPLNLFNANIFYPLPNTLAFSEHLISSAALALPIQLISGEPLVAYNLTLLISFPLAAFGMYLLTLHWTHCRSAAFIAGLIFGFAPYRFAAIAHLQLLTFQWLPFALLFLEKVFSGRRSTWRYAVSLTLFLTMQLLASWYLAIYTLFIFAIFIAVAVLITLLSRPAGTATGTRQTGVVPLLVSLAVTFGLTWLLAYPYLELVEQLRQARPLGQGLALAATATDYAAAASFNTIFGPLTQVFRDRPNFTEENTLFLGCVAPVLALVGMGLAAWGVKTRQRPRLSSEASDTPRYDPRADWLRLWPTLSLILIASLALTFPAPYRLLTDLIPAGTIVRVPPRWIIPALFALAGLAALGFVQISRLRADRSPQRFSLISTLLPVGVVVLLLLETLSVPLPLAAVENQKSLNPAYAWLSRQPDAFALLELPLHSAPAPEFPEVKRLYASTLGWWPLINGYSGYTPPRQPKLAQALATFPDADSIETLRLLARQTAASGTADSVDGMQKLYLLIHPGEAPLDRSRWETIDRWRIERDPIFQPLGQFEGDFLYRVLPAEPDHLGGPPLARFGTDQPIELLAGDLHEAPHSLTLFWQSTARLPADYTVFIHLRAPDGFVRSQADGPPVSATYPTTRWQPLEIIQDIHPLSDVDADQADHIAVGLYDPATGQRLPAFASDGRQLADDAVIFSLD